MTGVRVDVEHTGIKRGEWGKGREYSRCTTVEEYSPLGTGGEKHVRKFDGIRAQVAQVVDLGTGAR